MRTYTAKRILIGQLQRGTDLYDSIRRIAEVNNIRIGRVTGMGAVQRAKLAYYDQHAMKYSDLVFAEPMEIVNLYGNISVRDGRPFPHVHTVLSDETGQCRGGHLLPGETPVFACEIVIEEFDGPDLVRGFDQETGLTLWPTDAVL